MEKCSPSYRAANALLLISALGLAPSFTLAEESVPERPNNITESTCKQYSSDAWAALHAEYDREQQCMSSTRANISQGSECNELTMSVHHGIMAWPHCQNAERHCALKAAFNDSFNCMAQARKNAKDKQGLRDTLETAKSADEALSTARKIHDFISDPDAFVAKYVIDKATEASRQGLRKTVLNENGKLTPLGYEAADELYDWGFKRSTVDSGLLSDNPLINAIQSESFNGLAGIHQQMLLEMNGLGAAISTFGDMREPAMKRLESTRPPETSTAAPAKAKVAGGDCSILDDARSATNLSIEDPAKFDALMARCGG